MLSFRFKIYSASSDLSHPDLSPKPDFWPVFWHENVTNRENLYFNELIGKFRLNFRFYGCVSLFFHFFLLFFKINLCLQNIQPILENKAHIKSFGCPICHQFFFVMKIWQIGVCAVFFNFLHEIWTISSHISLLSTFQIIKRSN